MKTVQVSDLSGAALDWAVAMAEGLKIRTVTKRGLTIIGHSPYLPRKVWNIAGPIIEREEIAIEPIAHYDSRDHVSGWDALMYYNGGLDVSYTGETPLLAAMRCYVASKYGDTIEVPAVLVEGEA